MMKTIEGYTYKINQHIGKGYSSTVHKGVNDKTGQPVSIKVIEMAKLEDPINQMLLQHQITALKKLSSSAGVLHLYDVYATKNNTYIITELCDGDLGSLLKKRKNIPYHQSVQIIRQIINGYLDVYNSGYLHRDIKPANIFYKGSSYKIGDFGFAIPKKQLDQHKNYNVGSPVYMPPEALKDNIYSVSCDTWAIGIIFYQLIRGVVPWRAISQQKLHQKMISQPLDQLTQGLPEIAKTFLSRVLHLDAKMRMTIQQMVSWPSKLSSIEIVNTIPNCSPLRQLKNNSNVYVQNNQIKPILTPKQMPNSPFRFHPILQQPMQGPLIHKHTNSNVESTRPPSYPKQISMVNFVQTNQINKFQKNFLNQSEQAIIQQTGKNAMSLINYLTFLHRILKFLGQPSRTQLPDLVNAITFHLLSELDFCLQLMRDSNSNQFEKWDAFLSSQKGIVFKNKLSQQKNKFRMFHSVSERYSKQLNEDLIKDGIEKLLLVAQGNENGSEKTVVSIDYLTTLFQLWHLKTKYNIREFIKMSKIDMIIEGNPYSVTYSHLGQIKRKLALIDIIEAK